MQPLIRSSLKQTQRATLCALLLFCPVAVAAAEPSATQIATYEKLSETERFKLLMFLSKSPDSNTVSHLLKMYPLEGPYAANRILFLEGEVLKTQGKYTQAVAKFRKALADDPSLTLVRSELAQTLVILQEDDSALHQLKLLEADAPDTEAASSIRSFIDQVDSRRPYTFTGYVAFAPSTNLNGGSKHKTVYSTLGTFNTEAPKSGIGISSGLSGAITKRLGNDFMFVAAGGADATLYGDNTFNNYGFSQSAELRYLITKGFVGLGIVSSQQLDNQKFDPNYLSYGPRASASLQLTPKDHLSLGALHEWRDTLQKGSPTTTAINLDASWTHAWKSSFNTTIFSGFDRVNTTRKVSSYKMISAGLSVYKELTYGITATVTGTVSKSEFDAVNGLAGKKRADKRISSSIALTKRDINLFGFAPSVSYTFTDNFSNIGQYDFVSQSMDFRLTKDF
jgi:outer membrane protein